MDNILSIANVINVTISAVPVGLGIPNVNNIALFTTETPGNADVFRSYIEPTSVGTDYGTSSVTKAMADNIFAQTPNPLSGGGRLVIIPMLLAISATLGKTVTADITANLAAIQAVTDGEFNIAIDGDAEDIENLDFSEADDFDDIAQIMQNAIGNAIVTRTGTGEITFQSKTGGASSIILITASGGAGTDMVVAGLLNIAGAAKTDGVNSSGETLVEAITRTSSLANFAGILTNLEMEDAVVTAAATSIQALNLIWVHHFSSTAKVAGVCTTIKAANQFKTRCLLFTTSLPLANLMKAAYVGRMFSTNFSGFNTTQTANLKTLTNVIADGGISQTIYDACKVAGADIYVSYDGLPRTLSTGGNTYFDRVYNQQQYKFELQTNGFNYLATTSTKIPQTEVGMDGLKSAYNKINNRFVVNGFLGTGLTWNSADTFGDPADFKRNITDSGFFTYSQPISQQLQAERDLRQAPLVQIALKEAGSIHESIVNVFAEA